MIIDPKYLYNALILRYKSAGFKSRSQSPCGDYRNGKAGERDFFCAAFIIP